MKQNANGKPLKLRCSKLLCKKSAIYRQKNTEAQIHEQELGKRSGVKWCDVKSCGVEWSEEARSEENEDHREILENIAIVGNVYGHFIEKVCFKCL